jgi:hypothetical protein
MTPPPRPPLETFTAFRGATVAKPDGEWTTGDVARYAIHLEAQLAEHERQWEALTGGEAVEAGVNGYAFADDKGMRLESRVRYIVNAARTAARRRGP